MSLLLPNSKEKSFLFNNCDDDAKKILIGAMEEVRAAAAEKVIQQGDDGDFLFVIEQWLV